MIDTNNILVAMGLYVLLMLCFGMKHVLQRPVFKDFILAGARHGRITITLSLLASIIGGSATLGLLSMSLTKGAAIFWWLGLGACGLLLNALVFAEKLRDLRACTLPHVAQILVGKEARLLMAGVIVLSWLGIIAAQFSALSQLFGAFFGVAGMNDAIFIGVALVVIVYTVCGGQLSVLRTDAVQFFVIVLGLGLPCLYMYAPEHSFNVVFANGLGLFHEGFSGMDFIKLALLVGSTYCIGPDIFSRIFTARDGRVARQSLFLAALVLFAFAAMMSLLGAWLYVFADKEQSVLLTFLQLPMPNFVIYLFMLALISALLSSVDTCLMTAATIMEHDVLQGSSLMRLRFFLVLFGCLALGIVLLQDQIIPLLLASYAVYVPGIVCPLAIALLAYPKRPLHKGVWLSAVVFGSLCGIMATLTANNLLPFIGMAGSLLLSLASLYFGTLHNKTA